MSTTPAKTLSPQELAKLESAFNSDPGSDAYRPLAEAYLAAGRFMEAMVVCKKGVKAHPNRPDPRLLLARVYAEQGKDKKALDELQGALGVAPTDRTVLRALAEVQMRSGDSAGGKTTLQKVWDLDPKDPETAAAFAHWKLEPPKPPPPPEPPPAPVAPSGPRGGPPRLSEVPAGSGPSTARTRSMNGMPVQRPAAPRSAESEDDDQVRLPAARKGRATRFILTAVAGVAIIGGWYGWGQWKAGRDIKLKKSLKEASEQLRHDSFASYKKATDAATAALDIDPNSALAHGYLAYAYAIRWGEHGDGDDARRFAEEHLASVRRLGDQDSRFADAAEALLASYSGKATQALATLETKVKALDEKGQTSAFLELTQGIIQMQVGDLEKARDSLEKAQQAAPSDPRVYSALGTLHRRRGDARAADQNYGFALRYEKDHPESLLGRALLALDSDNAAGFPVASTNLRKLLDAEPPPSPRQLAVAHLARALLVSRVQVAAMGVQTEVGKKLAEATGVPFERAAATALAAKEDEEGFALDRNNPELHLLRGKRLLVEGQADAAVREMREAVKADPSRAQAYVDLARALMQTPEGAGAAEEALTTAIRTMGESPRLMVMLGQVYFRQGRLDEAAAQYLKALTDPKSKNPDARLELGVVYREKKDYPKAIEQLARASQEFIGQGARIAEALTELGRTYEAAGDRTRADEAFRRALDTDPGAAGTYFFYARVLGADRRTREKARVTAAKYLELEPRGEHAADAQALSR
ncbi:MAG TPA: tetratricopeptide repeat protein [Myxococcaceae bacterium]|nr:tetratricopeptide repeat protein [Myxococcaceae bacterium]